MMCERRIEHNERRRAIMSPLIGYLLPTREAVMEGRPEAAPLLRLAEKAEDFGYDSVWIGDSIIAKPRHDPLTLMAGTAGRTKRVRLGTAVLLPALRNPVVLAHQVATIDQVSDGRVVLGVGIAADAPAIHAEFEAVGVPFEKRVGRMMEGLRLCRALWSGDPVDWDGRWKLQQAVVGPTPVQKGGPPIWGGGSAPASLKRAAINFDGWFPSGPTDTAVWGAQWRETLQHLDEAGRSRDDFSGAIYLTLSIDDDADKANQRLDEFLENYYNIPAATLRKFQAGFGGSAEEAAAWLKAYADEGASHIVIRFAGDHDNNLEKFAKMRSTLGW